MAQATTTRPPIALTTVFTPPPSCLGTVTYDGTTAWQNGVRQTGDPNCFPASFNNILFSYYTPGICPHSWTEAQVTTAPTDTIVWCCPSDYTLYTTSALILLANYCYSSLKTAVSNVVSIASLTNGPLPTNPTLVTLQPSNAANSIVYADVIQVHYQSSDTEVINLMSASAASNPATVSKTTSIPSATAASATTPSSKSSGASTSSATPAPSSTSSSALAPGAKAGIGVGVAVGIIALAGIAIFLILRKRRRRPTQPYATPPKYGDDTLSSSGQEQKGPQGRGFSEMDAFEPARRAEMDTFADKQGAETHARMMQEMPGSKAAVELGGH